MYAPAPKGLPYNWLTVEPEPEPKPCSCKTLKNGQWVYECNNKRRHNPINSTPRPRPRTGRRDALMARPDNVLTRATPFGFVEAFNLDPDKPGLAHELELQYLINTQDRELAPIWMEMRENGIDAISQSSALHADDDDDTIANALPDAEPIYVTPVDTRREQWWREEDYYRWECGPAIKARWVPVPDKNAISIKVIEQGSLTKAQCTDWLNAIVAEAKATNSIPKREVIAGALPELMERRAYYGDNWALSLMMPNEQDAYPQMRRVMSFLDEQDADPQRHRFDESDLENAYQATRPPYAGGGSLHFDDWDEVETGYLGDLDMDPEASRLFDLGEWEGRGQ